jgi:hypothetical protein
MTAQLIGPNILAGFALFKRPIRYIREPDGIDVGTYGFIGEAPADVPLVGDVGQVPSMVTLAVPDLIAAGVFPPQRYDKILYNGRTHTLTDKPRVQYDGETPVLVRMLVEG